VDLWFTVNGPFAHTEIIETTTVPGDDHKAEVDEIEAEIRELDLDADDYVEQVQALRSARARLLTLPSEPAQVIERPTGIIVSEVWQSLDDEAKRGYLLATGVKVRVRSNSDLRGEPGIEVRYLTGGDPHKVMGTLQALQG